MQWRRTLTNVRVIWFYHMNRLINHWSSNESICVSQYRNHRSVSGKQFGPFGESMSSVEREETTNRKNQIVQCARCRSVSEEKRLLGTPVFIQIPFRQWMKRKVVQIPNRRNVKQNNALEIGCRTVFSCFSANIWMVWQNSIFDATCSRRFRIKLFCVQSYMFSMGHSSFLANIN